MVINRRFLPQASDGGDVEQTTSHESAWHRVGVWDLEVNAGFLPAVLEKLNTSQSVLAFETVDAAVPRAVSTGGESTLAWANERIGRERVGEIADVLRHNVVASRLHAIGAQVRRRFGFDLLVVLTPDMIAFSEDDSIFWNYFSWSDDNVVVVSAADIREFANTAGRAFEVAIAAMMVTQVIAELLPSEAALFHREDRGCLFDFNESRVTLVNTFQEMRIEPNCLSAIPEPYRAAADRMAHALREASSAHFSSGFSSTLAHQVQPIQSDQSPELPTLDVLDYVEFGKLFVQWATDESRRPETVTDFINQLRGIAIVPDSLRTMNFVHKVVNFSSKETIEHIARALSFERPAPQFYQDPYNSDFFSIIKPVDSVIAQAAGQALSEE